MLHTESAVWPSIAAHGKFNISADPLSCFNKWALYGKVVIQRTTSHYGRPPNTLGSACTSQRTKCTVSVLAQQLTDLLGVRSICANPILELRSGLGIHTVFYERHLQLFSKLPYFRGENAWSRTKRVITCAYTLQPVILYQRSLLWLDEALQAPDYSGFGRLFQGKVGLHSYSGLPQNWQIERVFWTWITIPE